MSTSMEAWFETRPLTRPLDAPVPARSSAVVAFSSSADGTAELRILKRPDGYFSFEVVAWTNFEDAGRNPHHVWHTFHPALAHVSDSFDTVVEAALDDARARQLVLNPMVRVEIKR